MVLPTNDFTDGNVLTAAQLNNNFQSVNWMGIVITDDNNLTSFIAHSATNYSIIVAATGMWNNSTGAWVMEVGANDGFLLKCKTDPTYAFSINYPGGSTSTFVTIDAGVNWGAATDSPLDASTDDISFPTTDLIVVAGDDAGGDYIWWSADQGTNWTAALTTLDAKAHAMDMFDKTDGYAITNANKIFKASNDAKNWTDTGDTVVVSADGGIHCLTADLLLIGNTTSGLVISTYVNSTNTVTALQTFDGYDQFMGFAEDSNGVVYLAAYRSANSPGIIVIRSRDSFVTFEIILIPHIANAATITALGSDKRGCIDVDANDDLYIVIPETYTVVKIPAFTEP